MKKTLITAISILVLGLFIVSCTPKDDASKYFVATSGDQNKDPFNEKYFDVCREKYSSKDTYNLNLCIMTGDWDLNSCELSTDLSTKFTCRALNLNNFDECNNIPEPEYGASKRDFCYSMLITILKPDSEKVAECDKIQSKNSYYATTCRAVLMGDANECAGVSKEYSCIYSVAAETKDKEVCKEFFQDQDKIDSCYYEIVRRNKNCEICSEITKESTRGFCEGICS
jgi:hypothetical protein